MQRALPADQRTAAALRQAYVQMRAHFGHQHWWPGDSPFEICLGAILTQNTNWTNAARALDALRQANLLEPLRLQATPEPQLQELLRPAGCFRVKARRVRAFLDTLREHYDGRLEALFAGPLPEVRARLLAISGIGPETADCLLLYAAERPSFVIDAYTRRIFQRHGWCEPDSSYAELQSQCASALALPDAARQLDLWQDYHAQLVGVGKQFCRARRARCEACPLQSLLPGPEAVPLARR